MSVGKVIEVTAEGPSIEAAITAAVSEASSTVQGIQRVWLKDVLAEVENGEVVRYRIHAKLTFLVKH